MLQKVSGNHQLHDDMISNRTRGIVPASSFAVYLFILFLPHLFKDILIPVCFNTELIYGPSAKFCHLLYSFCSPTKLFIAVKITSKENLECKRGTNSLLECPAFKTGENVAPKQPGSVLIFHLTALL